MAASFVVKMGLGWRVLFDDVDCIGILGFPLVRVYDGDWRNPAPPC